MMGILGNETRNNEKEVINLDAPISGSEFKGIARTNESGDLLDTSNIIEQTRLIYQNNVNDGNVHAYLNLGDKRFYISDFIISGSNISGALIDGTFTLGMSDGAGNFDGIFNIPYSVTNNGVFNFNHQFIPALEFKRLLRSSVGGSVNYPWFSVYNSDAINVNFSINGWVEN